MKYRNKIDACHWYKGNGHPAKDCIDAQEALNVGSQADAEIDELHQEIRILKNTIGLMELGEGSFTRALDKLTEEVNEKLSVLTKELEELKKERN
ncbi:MAG TPA: hypothetical protein VMW36_02945, partial [Patescibacteria group bacterium]|nr:hypothetical protein [Patescibacteria group bacterium]